MGDVCDDQRRQTMSDDITAYVGLDVHKGSIAIGVAEPGRAAPHFVGTTGPDLAELTKALSRLGRPEQMLLAYEAGPCGYPLARQLAARGYRCEVIAVAKMPRKPGEADQRMLPVCPRQ
jgi:transposase